LGAKSDGRYCKHVTQSPHRRERGAWAGRLGRGFGGLQIDDQLEFGWLYDRQVGGLGALENFSGVELATYGDGRCQLWRLDAEQLGCLLQGLFKGAVVLSAFNPGW
jgi:hypothetical protein